MLTLVTCAKARAILHGRYHATVGDVQWLVKPALRHRIAGNYAAQANNLTSDKLIDMLLEADSGRPEVREAGGVKRVQSANCGVRSSRTCDRAPRSAV